MTGPVRVTRGDTLLLDIEGTTTPIAFVTGVLFPYARARLLEFLTRHTADPAVDRLVSAFHDEHEQASARGAPLPAWNDAPEQRIESAAAFAAWLMDRDCKSTALKELQGRIWEDGYRAGGVISDVFPDVCPAFERWTAAGARIAIFSSGSVLAQQLLFAHSSAGDLTRFVSAYFDTTTGPKRQSSSYQRIAEALRVPPPSILFVSDVSAELDAAAAAGMRTVLSIRPGNAPVAEPGRYQAVRSFDDLP